MLSRRATSPATSASIASTSASGPAPPAIPASRSSVSHSSSAPSGGAKTGADHFATLRIANWLKTRSYCECSSGESAGRITSAWRVVSLT